MNRPPHSMSLHASQFAMMLIGCTVGIGPLFIARIATVASGRDAWIVFLIYLAIILCNSLIMVQLAKRFPKQTFVQYVPELVGTWIGKCIGFILIVLGILTIAVTMKILSYIIATYVLLKTPMDMFNVIILMLLIYLVMFDLRVMGRLATGLFFVSFLFSYFYIPPVNDYGNVLLLMPFFENGWQGIWKGLGAILFSLSGLELFLTYYPYVDDKRNMRKYFIWSILFVGLLFEISLFTQQLVYPLKYLAHLWAPSIHYISIVEFPVFERTDAIFTIFWFTVLFKTAAVYMYHSVISIQQVFQVHQKRIIVFLVAVLGFAVTKMIGNAADIEKWMIYVLTANVGLSLILPSLLLMIAKFRRKGLAG